MTMIVALTSTARVSGRSVPSFSQPRPSRARLVPVRAAQDPNTSSRPTKKATSGLGWVKEWVDKTVAGREDTPSSEPPSRGPAYSAQKAEGASQADQPSEAEQAERGAQYEANQRAGFFSAQAAETLERAKEATQEGWEDLASVARPIKDVIDDSRANTDRLVAEGREAQESDRDTPEPRSGRSAELDEKRPE